MTNDLIERYIYAATKRLPGKSEPMYLTNFAQ